MIPWLEPNDPFPDASLALPESSGANGLLAASATIWPERLIEAYRNGIFPWFSAGQPVLWWSPNPRMVLRTDSLSVSRSLKKKLNQVRKSMLSGGQWQIRFDSAFEKVMRACAAPRKGDPGTWISEEMIENYVRLHDTGYAHSVELWQEGKLVGGAYGVSIGKMFYGESMFSRVSDASKIALAWLVQFLHQNGVRLIDCQQETAHLASLGATAISREAFSAHLAGVIDLAPVAKWIPPVIESF
ncbi:leucyl/phenylalanyl-tRNA--protein transferase [Oxalobacter vibrioformis]|uniref:Leucyl/phenylalanyl-tRNA--protein transferase n=1 Tax=Oxalobacter vibrioformis TaxID=933080 RepID=A0A9E9P3S6_9BURK|nr:leucyl/phenylalanyl-tRNA--protein transferase [Oxalobacter vibrioformis]WAW11294.1 leucyl/phenylalanyl-tRNA--protein transferase [Oxalobacter vibrioformis]